MDFRCSVHDLNIDHMKAIQALYCFKHLQDSHTVKCLYALNPCCWRLFH